jgi:hypothetical protein
VPELLGSTKRFTLWNMIKSVKQPQIDILALALGAFFICAAVMVLAR